MNDRQVFQDRGAVTTRIEAFVDAAFAFALTLLVISFDEIPASYGELVDALKGVPAFLASFAIITMFWLAHRSWSNRFGLDTTFSTLASLGLVFIILVYVYPLRAMMSAALNVMSGGWLPSSFAEPSAAEVRGLFVIYGVGFAAACINVAILFLHAYRQRDQLELSPQEIHTTHGDCIGWLIVAGIGGISVALALVLPDNSFALAGWVYWLLPIVMFVFGRLHARGAPPERG